MKELSRNIIGTTTGKETFEYAWRDIALYAAGVGAKDNETQYQYEVGLKALPTYGVVPYWGTFGITPHRDLPRNVTFSLNLDQEGSFHMAHKLILHQPIAPMGARLTIEDIITEVYDRNGKGAVVRSELTAYDESGAKVFTNVGDTIFGAYSVPSAPPYPKSTVVFPEREPDFTEKDFVAPNQHLLYRLSGDTNRLHVDLEEARQRGFDRPIMQGLCSFGFACRLAVRDLVPGQPERIKSIEAQMRNPLFPGTEIELSLWKAGDGRAYFRLMDLQNSRPVLEKGEIDWE
ncbi:hypothetical protein EQM14_04515 [Caproiciproducens sp. NJN-50]|uniref:MaoC/PaaZ C-terminal domain-containing protein n=1 Tax=Acutalibacteraceae TaxID=3082771 RepID=UPI000FFE2627|nr:MULTISPECIES: MaoC/PaaZ C-terminal domain-containing protein [Acutalibacteraceae]QAT49096.1 hypothetical protein EQM14_04515 [Caproiciproducens sp. NJN-50]